MPSSGCPAAKTGLSVGLAEVAYQGGFKPGWEDAGWGEREVKGPGPAKVMMAELGGWALRRSNPRAARLRRAGVPVQGALRLRRLPGGAAGLRGGGHVPPGAGELDGTWWGWTAEWVQLLIPMAELNPDRKPFDRFIIRAHKRWALSGWSWMGLGFTLPGVSMSEEAPQEASMQMVEVAFERGLKQGWEAGGWSERQVEGHGAGEGDDGGAGRVDAAPQAAAGQHAMARWRSGTRPLADYGELPGGAGGLRRGRHVPPGARRAQHVVGRDGDWAQVLVPMAELNPQGHPFDRVIMRAHKRVGSEWVQLDRIGFTSMAVAEAGMPAAGMARVAIGPPRPASLSVDCTAPGQAISPLIYGIAFDALQEAKDTHQFELGATARRWGGNPTSRYNWKLGNAWNTANDWFFRNVNYTGDGRTSPTSSFLEANREHGAADRAHRARCIGWVAKDTSSVGFPVSKFGAAGEARPGVPEAGNGRTPTASTLSPPHAHAHQRRRRRPSSSADGCAPSAQKDAKRGAQRAACTSSTTSRCSGTRPTATFTRSPLTYDELLGRPSRYGTAVRKADPDAVIAGPAEWGWTGYFFSAADAEAGLRAASPTGASHGDVPLLAWYLQKLREHEKKTGAQLLDVLDVHFYPQAEGVGVDGRRRQDRSRRRNALRIRSTRALWDPTTRTSRGSSEPVRLIPADARSWIAQNYPGLGIAIGEYNFGAEQHMSGGLALAEALGRFGAERRHRGLLLDLPAEAQPAFWAFRAYRNYDGEGGRFQDSTCRRAAEEGTSLFASRSADGQHVVAIALNLAPDTARDARVESQGLRRAEVRPGDDVRGRARAALPSSRPAPWAWAW